MAAGCWRDDGLRDDGSSRSSGGSSRGVRTATPIAITMAIMTGHLEERMG